MKNIYEIVFENDAPFGSDFPYVSWTYHVEGNSYEEAMEKAVILQGNKPYHSTHGNIY